MRLDNQRRIDALFVSNIMFPRKRLGLLRGMDTDTKFLMPTRIVFGSGSISQLKTLVEEDLRLSRPYLVTDPGIQEAGIAENVVSQFPGMPVFDEVEQNPKHSTVDRAGEQARKYCPDLIIGLGGGSAIDAAKAVALLATNPGNIEDYEGKGKYKAAPLPVLAIPTTCGTGSEVTWVSVVTHTGRQFKMSIKGPLMFPAVALVDPDLLSTLPAPLVASTGLDALTHAVEAYTVKPATFITDIFAREAILHIFSSLEIVYADIKQNRDAREKLMKGSLLAGIAFCNSDVGAVHCISEAVGSLYDTPHGVANAVFLPPVMDFNLPASAQRYSDIARLVGISGEDEKAAAQSFIQRIRDLSRTLHIPHAKEIGLREKDFAEIAEKAYQNNSNPSNPREARAEDYFEILSKAFFEIR
jgi:alcohol dehydrogenase